MRDAQRYALIMRFIVIFYIKLLQDFAITSYRILDAINNGNRKVGVIARFCITIIANPLSVERRAVLLCGGGGLWSLPCLLNRLDRLDSSMSRRSAC